MSSSESWKPNQGDNGSKYHQKDVSEIRNLIHDI